MTQTIIEHTNFFSYENILIRFKRAKSEATLDTMYRGAINKANGNLEGKELLAAHIAIERALDRCQQDFDTSLLGIARKANHTLKQAQESCNKYNPEDEMRRLLSLME
ncbi:hypothetical protein ACTFBW_16525 [Aeromonas rivipollensis]